MASRPFFGIGKGMPTVAPPTPLPSSTSFAVAATRRVASWIRCGTEALRRVG